MGLDIYFYKASSKEKGLKYIKAYKDQYKYSSHLYKKYDKQITKARNAWIKWSENFDNLIQKDIEFVTLHSIDYDKWCEEYDKKLAEYSEKYPQPKIDETEFATDEEKAEMNRLNENINEASNGVKDSYSDNIEALYMRKQYWMVKYVNERHPELLVTDDYGDMVIEMGYAVLDYDDIKELVERIEKILSYHDLAESLLPIRDVDDEFNVFDEYYFRDIKRYCNEFKKLLPDLEKGEALIFNASW